ncbi:MAG: Gfo/Idh/MocA family oxidoreductase [Acidobacteria bacterium]|nr:Gfo/Idh/MocA family oxidoreductase [Acidobacteriota bacterium]
MQKVTIAVIGAGEHGKRHAHAFRQVPGAELVGVYDQQADRALSLASELGTKVFASLEETLAAAKAVSIVIPTTAHAAVASAAVASGVDVLVEKPITRTVEEAEELIQAADRAGRILQVGHLERFNPGVVAAKAVTRQPLFFEIHRLGVFSPRSLDVDVVFDLMIHDLDLVLWMVGSPVREVRAVGLPVLSDKVDIANARVEFENGTVANLTASRVSTEKVRKFRYFQPHEYISIDFSRRDSLLLSVNHDGTAPGIGFRKLEASTREPLQAELESFVRCVRTRRPPLVGGREGRDALALAERVMFCIEEHAGRVHVPMTRSLGHSGEL